MIRKISLSFIIMVGISLWLMVSTGMVMEPGKVSWTTQSVCFFRLITAMHPDPKLPNPDYLAEKFVFIPYTLRKDCEAARMTMNGYRTGAYYFLNARTHHIDTLLKHMADTGATQVIILGAGFHSRRYRFAKAYHPLRFYEVELPATIEWKKETVIRISYLLHGTEIVRDKTLFGGIAGKIERLNN